jgi:hypothetical protein
MMTRFIVHMMTRCINSMPMPIRKLVFRFQFGFRLLKRLRTELPVTETVSVRRLEDDGREQIHPRSESFYGYWLSYPVRYLRLPGNMSFLARGIALFYWGFSVQYFATYHCNSELHMCKVKDAERALTKFFDFEQKFRKRFKK